MHHQNLVYLTTDEHYGVGLSGERLPSIYWSVVEPELPGFCGIFNRDWGVIASSEGLATAYPVIAARKTALSGAVLAYTYGGAGTIAGGQFPAYAGAQTSTVSVRSQGVAIMASLISVIFARQQRHRGRVGRRSGTGRGVQPWRVQMPPEELSLV